MTTSLQAKTLVVKLFAFFFFFFFFLDFFGFMACLYQNADRIVIIPSLIGPGFNSTSPARMSNMSSSRPKEAVSIPAVRRFSIDLRFSQPYPRSSDPTRKSMSARRIGGKTQALVSWHKRLLKKLLLLSNSITRVNSATKGRK